MNTYDNLKHAEDVVYIALREAQAVIKKHVNLCDLCKYHPAECDGNPEFGNGIGNDNVYQCDSYEEKPRT